MCEIHANFQLCLPTYTNRLCVLLSRATLIFSIVIWILLFHLKWPLRTRFIRFHLIQLDLCTSEDCWRTHHWLSCSSGVHNITLTLGKIYCYLQPSLLSRNFSVLSPINALTIIVHQNNPRIYSVQLNKVSYREVQWLIEIQKPPICACLCTGQAWKYQFKLNCSLLNGWVCYCPIFLCTVVGWGYSPK